MKRPIELLILAAVIASVHALTSCAPGGGAPSAAPPPSPPPHEVLREQVEQERQLRSAAETRASAATSGADFWQAAAVLLGAGACAAFLFGTAIGSNGKSHARS